MYFLGSVFLWLYVARGSFKTRRYYCFKCWLQRYGVYTVEHASADMLFIILLYFFLFEVFGQCALDEVPLFWVIFWYILIFHIELKQAYGISTCKIFQLDSLVFHITIYSIKRRYISQSNYRSHCENNNWKQNYFDGNFNKPICGFGSDIAQNTYRRSFRGMTLFLWLVSQYKGILLHIRSWCDTSSAIESTRYYYARYTSWPLLWNVPR